MYLSPLQYKWQMPVYVGFFKGLFRNFNMQTKQLSTYVYWKWQYIKSLLRPQLYNGNLILKYLSSGAVNFISASAKIRGVFPHQRSAKHIQSIGKIRNVLFLILSIFTIKYLSLFALRLVCFRQAGECPISGRFPKKCSVLKYQRLLWKWNSNLFSKSLYSDFVLHLCKKSLAVCHRTH